MKKLITLIAIALLACNLMAQQVSTDESFRFDGIAPVNYKALMQKFQTQPTKELPVGWMVPSWSLLDYFWGTNSMVTHYANLIFPDSTPVYETGGNILHNWLCSVGGVFDPYSEMFDSLQFQPLIGLSDTYRIDSIFVLSWYNVIYSGTSDTLVLELEYGNPHTAPEFAWTVFNFPDDTFNMSPPKVLGSTIETGYQCQMTAPTKTVVKYPLTLNDSTNYFGKYITIPVNYYVPAGKIVGLSVTFVPGNAYAFGDTLFSYSHTAIQTMNCIRIGLYGTTNTTTDPHVFIEPYYRWSSHNYINSNVRYSRYTGSNAWRNERMVSTVNWGFDIGYHVTNTTPGVGVQENRAVETRMYPNPSAGSLYIENVVPGSRIRITDVTGHCVIARIASNAHEYINLQALQNGLYFVGLEKNGYTSTQKIVLNR